MNEILIDSSSKLLSPKIKMDKSIIEIKLKNETIEIERDYYAITVRSGGFRYNIKIHKSRIEEFKKEMGNVVKISGSVTMTGKIHDICSITFDKFMPKDSIAIKPKEIREKDKEYKRQLQNFIETERNVLHVLEVGFREIKEIPDKNLMYTTMELQDKEFDVIRFNPKLIENGFDMKTLSNTNNKIYGYYDGRGDFNIYGIEGIPYNTEKINNILKEADYENKKEELQEKVNNRREDKKLEPLKPRVINVYNRTLNEEMIKYKEEENSVDSRELIDNYMQELLKRNIITQEDYFNVKIAKGLKGQRVEALNALKNNQSNISENKLEEEPEYIQTLAYIDKELFIKTLAQTTKNFNDFKCTTKMMIAISEELIFDKSYKKEIKQIVIKKIKTLSSQEEEKFKNIFYSTINTQKQKEKATTLADAIFSEKISKENNNLHKI